MHELSKFVLGAIRKRHLLHPGDRVGVAVSGGVDSVALLRILLELRAELGLVLSVVHLNHCLRGSESDGDEQFVRELAAHYDLPFFSARQNIKSHAAERELSIEAAARELRYRYFEELLRKGEFNKLATAHTVDDQAETVLLKLSRGAGTRGIAGIYPRVTVAPSRNERSRQMRDTELAIIRPLLSVQRNELEQYLAQMQQPWREDSTNAQLHHTRNRIRHEILPRLCADVSPQVRQTLAEIAEIARAEEEFWQDEIPRHLTAILSREGQKGILRSSLLNELPLAVRRRVVRGAAELLGLSLEFKHVDKVLSLPNGARAVLPDGWIALYNRGFICLERGIPTTVGDYEYKLNVPGRLEIPEAGVVLEIVVLDGKDDDPSYNSEHALDAGFADGLVVRNWRPGDRFWPPHSKQPKKIKELLQNRYITGDQKKAWPVIAKGSEIVWMRGFGIRSDLRTRNDAGIIIRDEPRVTGQ